MTLANLESVLQATTVSMLRSLYPDLVINLSLNGISLDGLTPQQKAQLIREAKSQGMETGIPDLLIYLPNAQILNLEFKRPKGGVQSPDQIAIQTKLSRLGHNYHLVRDYPSVFKLIAEHTSAEFRKSQLDIYITSSAFKVLPNATHLYFLGASDGSTS